MPSFKLNPTSLDDCHCLPATLKLRNCQATKARLGGSKSHRWNFSLSTSSATGLSHSWSGRESHDVVHGPLPSPHYQSTNILRSQICRDFVFSSSLPHASIRQCSSLFCLETTQLDPAFCWSSDRVVSSVACDFEARRRIQSGYGTIRAARVLHCRFGDEVLLGRRQRDRTLLLLLSTS